MIVLIIWILQLFVVNGDLDYVVVYGVKGNQVAYTIRYVDENGKQLSEDTVFIWKCRR